jgi:hypothetical protein
VAGPELLEGERIVRVVRTHPLGRLAGYGPGLALLAWAGALGALFSTLEGQGFARGLDGAGPLAVPLLLVLWWVGLALATGPFALRAGLLTPLAYGVGLAVAGGFAAVLLTTPDPSAAEAAQLLPFITLVGALPALALGEFMRRARTWYFTNFRLVLREGWVRVAEEAWRLTKVERIGLEQRWLRSLDYGDLLVKHAGGELRIEAVRPLTRLRDELELLVEAPPEAPFLGDQRDAADKVSRLLRPGDGKA